MVSRTVQPLLIYIDNLFSHSLPYKLPFNGFNPIYQDISLKVQETVRDIP